MLSHTMFESGKYISFSKFRVKFQTLSYSPPDSSSRGKIPENLGKRGKKSSASTLLNGKGNLSLKYQFLKFGYAFDLGAGDLAKVQFLRSHLENLMATWSGNLNH